MKGPEDLSPVRVRAARIVAVAADLVQIAVVPAFTGGLASPLNDALDVAVAAAMVLLVGWHWAFLPSFFSELIPFWDLVPTWTAAAFIATRGRGKRPSGAAIETEVVARTPPKNGAC
jgi:hypothetical protein